MKPHSCRVVKLTESGRKVRNRTQLCNVSTSDRPRAASMVVPKIPPSTHTLQTHPKMSH